MRFLGLCQMLYPNEPKIAHPRDPAAGESSLFAGDTHGARGNVGEGTDRPGRVRTSRDDSQRHQSICYLGAMRSPGDVGENDFTAFRILRQKSRHCKNRLRLLLQTISDVRIALFAAFAATL